MTENVEFADRFMNKNGSLRKTPLKKKRAISKLEFFIPEYEYRRLKKMKDPIETLERPVEHMTVYRNDGSSVTLTAENLVGTWHVAEDEKENSTAIEALPGAMEFANSMEITSDGHISWYIGADGGTGTYSLSGDILSADMTNDFDQSSMKMEFTAEKTDDGTFLYTEYKGLLLCWSQGEGETGKGGDDEAESGYPGADVVELVNLRGDTTTVYKLADGTYMDCIERRFIYNGTDTWTDEDGGSGSCKF